MTATPHVPVDSAEVIWTYLAHEHTYKATHTGIADRFELAAIHYPVRLNATADDLIAAVAVAVEASAERCHPAVLLTARIFQQLRWRLVDVSVDALGGVNSILPNEFSQRGAYEPGRQGPVRDLLPGWLAYLEIDHEQARRDARGHEQLLAELSSAGRFSHRLILRDEPGRTVIGDGRHRIFAAYHHAKEHPGFTMPVYWGRT